MTVPAGAAEARPRLVKMIPAVATFALSALGYVGFGFLCLLVPMVATAAVFFLYPRPAAG